MDSRRLGKAIRKARTAQGYSLEVLADKAGISDRYLADVERGNRSVSVDVAAKIATGLGMTLQKLLDTVAKH